METSHPFLKDIDYVGVHINQPEPVLQFLHEALDLPLAFPLQEFPGYTSAAVSLGNMYLEITRFGEAKQNDPAKLAILGFTHHGISFQDLPDELDDRRILHSPILPFYDPQSSDEEPVTLWQNLYLGGILGTNLVTRYFFFTAARRKNSPSQQTSSSSRTLNLLKRSFPNGMLVFTEYANIPGSMKKPLHRTTLRRRHGGKLGLLGVQSVVVSAPYWSRARRAWERLLKPIKPDSKGGVNLGAGPQLRLAEGAKPAISTLILQVKSTSRAIRALKEAEAEVYEHFGRWAFSLPGAEEISFRLIE